MTTPAKKTQAVIEVQPPTALVPVTPLDMLNQAVTSGASVEVMAKLMDLHDRWEAGRARRAFDEAIAEAKAEIGPIVKNKAGHNNKKYADFAAIASVVDPVLGRHGLSYRFRTAQTDRISVTCVLSHKGGHAEETTLAGPPDASGSKNAIQAIGSTLTYLQRYSLVQALGLAATDDDDGNAAGIGESITDDQVLELRDLILTVGAAEAKFCKVFLKGATLEEMPIKRFNEAVAELKAFGRERGIRV